MSPDALPPLLEAGSTVRVLAPGELLFRQGDRAAAIYKVESGRLRLIRRTVDDHLVILHTARRGEFFAEASLFAEAYHCAWPRKVIETLSSGAPPARCSGPSRPATTPVHAACAAAAIVQAMITTPVDIVRTIAQNSPLTLLPGLDPGIRGVPPSPRWRGEGRGEGQLTARPRRGTGRGWRSPGQSDR
jgi:hypothetical protein